VANSKAWKISTILARTEVMAGPRIMAGKPVPVGCEQLPVTEGSFSADRTKMKAPIKARSGLASGVCFVILVKR